MDEVFLTEYEKERVQEKLVNSAFLEGKQEGIEEGIEKGIEQGIEKGIEQTKVEIIKSMLKDKVPVETISKYTNLSVEEIKKLIND